MNVLINIKRAQRIRKKLKKINLERYRLTVFRSSRNISAQIVDDKNNVFYFLNTIRKWFDIDQKQYEFILTDLNENNYDNTHVVTTYYSKSST